MRRLVESPSAGEPLLLLRDICLAGFPLSFVDLSGRWPFLRLHDRSAKANPLLIFLSPLPSLRAAQRFPRSDVTFRKAKALAELLFFSL